MVLESLDVINVLDVLRQAKGRLVIVSDEFGMDRDDEPPLDEDYIEPDMDSAAYSYLDELASEHAAEPSVKPVRKVPVFNTGPRKRKP